MVDSIAEENGHQVYYLNTLFFPCDTCDNLDCEDPWGMGYNFHQSNFPNFLQKEVHLTTDNRTIFKNENIFVILHLATENQSWIFDTLQNISAVISQMTYEDLFQGISDSIKYIELSNGEMIKLSKSYGVIEFPDFYYSGQTYYLQGGRISDLAFGEEVPDFWDIYDYQVGDVFCRSFSAFYSSQDSPSPPPGYSTLYKTTILSKDILEDKFIYTRYVKEAHSSSNIPEIEIYYDTLMINYSPTDFCNTLPGMMSKGYYTSKAYIAQNPLNEEPSLSRYNNEEFIKCELYEYEYMQVSGIYNVYYTPTLGMVYSYMDVPQSIYTKQLVGYIRNGDTIGAIYHDSLFGIINTVAHTKFNEISVYPIPTSDLLAIENLISTDQYSFTLYDISGVLVMEASISNVSEHILEVGKIKPGIYFLKVNDTRNTFVEKIIIVEGLK